MSLATQTHFCTHSFRVNHQTALDFSLGSSKMTSQENGVRKGYLYLDRINVQSSLKSSYRVELQLDGDEVELTRDKEGSTWTLSRHLEVPAPAKLIVVLKKGHGYGSISFGKEKTTININSKDAFEQFWISKEAEIAISETTTFYQLPVTVTLKFVSSPESGSVRAALHKLQEKMKEYSHLIGSSTQHNIDGALKSGANPFASATFSVASLLKKQQQYDEMVSDLSDEIGRVLPLADKVLDDVVREDTKQLSKIIRRMYSLTVDTAEFLCVYVQQSTYVRAAKSFVSSKDQEKISEFKSEFTKSIQDFNQAVNVEALRSIKLVEEKLLLDRLEPVKTGYSLDRCCMEGTREVLLDNIIEWAVNPRTGHQESTGTHIYWLYGIPGVGKTSMAHSVCARLHKKGRLGGSFFCRRDDPNLADPKCVLPTLVFKLAESWGPFRRVVAEKLRSDPHLTRNSAGYNFLPQLLDMLESHPSEPLVFIIDALDECGDIQTRNSILNGLFCATSRVGWLRIIVTSRQEQDITLSFDRLLGAGHYVSEDLAANDKAQQDIRVFAQTRLSSIALECHLPDDWPGPETMDRIIMKSGGLFIFVETLWRLIKDDVEPDKRLHQTLSDASGGLSAGLYSLHSSIIETRMGQNKAAFRATMGTIIAVGMYRPLRDESVAQLAGLGTHVVRVIVDKLGSLLYRDIKENGGIRVRHLSIIDFLTWTQCPSVYRVEMGQANMTVGISCLKLMTLGLKFNICDLETSLRPNKDVPGLNERIKEKLPDVLQYGCIYWSNHLCHIADSEDSEIYGFLNDFVKDLQLLYWIEVLSLLDQVLVGNSSMRRVLSWTKVSKAPFIEPMQDALRFLVTFHTAIITSTPHIYISALPFTPTESNLWKTAAEIFHRLPRLSKGQMKTWPARPHKWLGHTDCVRGVVYSPNGRNVASCSYDKTIRIWDVETGALVGEPLRGHTGWVCGVAYSPDGRRIVSGSSDRTIRIWDAQNLIQIGEPIMGHTNWINCVAYSPDGQYIASGSDDTMIRIWDAKTGTLIGEPLQGHTRQVGCLVFSLDGHCVISGSDDKTIRIWDHSTGLLDGKPLEGHTGGVGTVACSPNGQYIVSGSDDKTIRIWEISQQSQSCRVLKGHTGSVFCVSYSPDGRHIVSGSGDKTLRIWDANLGDCIGQLLIGHTSWINSVSYSPDGLYIVSGSEDTTIRIWDAQTGAPVGEESRGHEQDIKCVAYSPDGHLIASGSDDNTIRIWNAETGDPVCEPLQGHTAGVMSIAYSQDGIYLVSGSVDKSVRIWDVASRAQVGEPLNGHTGLVYSVSYSPSGDYIVSGSEDNTIRIWDIKNRKTSKIFTGHTSAIFSVAYSPSGDHVASGSGDGTIRIWNVNTGNSVVIKENSKGYGVRCVAYSPDGHHIISGSNDQLVRRWNAETGAQIGNALEHPHWVSSVAYSPDGLHIVSGCQDNCVRIWDAESGDQIGIYRGHTHWITSVAYSPDGQRIISGSDDRTIRIWDAQIAQNNTVNIVPNSNGWIHDSDGGLLLWVPEDCRSGLACPAILTIPTTGRSRVVRVDLSEACLGESWMGIKKADD
ncbi:WD40 repeat-like protein [Serendipita vermifera]|nr:WD40 repeat-like protein [Serendipita vermifera]